MRRGCCAAFVRCGRLGDQRPQQDGPSNYPLQRTARPAFADLAAAVLRLLRRRGLAGDEDVAPPDPLAEESLALAGISAGRPSGEGAEAAPAAPTGLQVR